MDFVVTIDCKDRIFEVVNGMINQLDIMDKDKKELMRIYYFLLRQIREDKCNIGLRMDQAILMAPQSIKKALTDIKAEILSLHHRDEKMARVNKKIEQLKKASEETTEKRKTKVVDGMIIAIILKKIIAAFPRLSTLLKTEHAHYIDYGDLLRCRSWADFYDRELWEFDCTCANSIDMLLKFIYARTAVGLNVSLVFENIDQISNPSILKEIRDLVNSEIPRLHATVSSNNGLSTLDTANNLPTQSRCHLSVIQGSSTKAEPASSKRVLYLVKRSSSPTLK